MKNTICLLSTILIFLIISSCKKKGDTQEEQPPAVSVKAIPINQGDIENNISLNGKTIYLKKNAIASPITGYIAKINIKFGDIVRKNDVLFEIQTKESKALENTGTLSDNMGLIKVLASSDGTIYELNITEIGGYVMEGSLLCSIIENEDLTVQVNVPFEYDTLLKTGLKCKIFLSDNTVFDGNIYKILPIINETDQTQIVLIKPVTIRQLPENLNLTVQFVNTKHINSFLIPRKAVMTNEMQNEFWVMKIINNNLAVKVPFLKGIENDSLVEILSPDLNINDWVISEGAYGLPDSTIVRIEK